jgi:hypothetical protein
MGRDGRSGVAVDVCLQPAAHHQCRHIVRGEAEPPADIGADHARAPQLKEESPERILVVEHSAQALEVDQLHVGEGVEAHKCSRTRLDLGVDGVCRRDASLKVQQMEREVTSEAGCNARTGVALPDSREHLRRQVVPDDDLPQQRAGSIGRPREHMELGRLHREAEPRGGARRLVRADGSQERADRLTVPEHGALTDIDGNVSSRRCRR